MGCRKHSGQINWDDPDTVAAYHREYGAARYALLKSMHCCTRCKKKDARTMAGHVACAACYEKMRKEKEHG